MRKHLSKLQLSFHAVDGQPSDSNLIESYTMGFTYQDGAVVSDTSGMAGDDQIQGSQKIMVFDSKREVKDFIDNILFFFYQHKSKSGRLRDYPLPCKWLQQMRWPSEATDMNIRSSVPNGHVYAISRGYTCQL